MTELDLLTVIVRIFQMIAALTTIWKNRRCFR